MAIEPLTPKDEVIASLRGTIEAVREMHAPRRQDGDGYTVIRCRECGWNHPCPTVQALPAPTKPDPVTF